MWNFFVLGWNKKVSWLKKMFFHSLFEYYDSGWYFKLKIWNNWVDGKSFSSEKVNILTSTFWFLTSWSVPGRKNYSSDSHPNRWRSRWNFRPRTPAFVACLQRKNQSYDQSTYLAINQSIKPPITRTINQSINQLVKQVNQSTPSITQSINQSIN